MRNKAILFQVAALQEAEWSVVTSKKKSAPKKTPKLVPSLGMVLPMALIVITVAIYSGK